MPDLASLRPVEWNDRAFLHRALALHAAKQSCECAEGNLFLWQEAYGEKFVDADGRFWVIETATGIPHFPIGEFFAPPELYRLAMLAKEAGFQPVFYDVPETYAEVPDAARYFDISCDEDTADYLYDLAQQSELAGPLLRKKRNLVRQFERNNPEWSLEIITPEKIPETVELAIGLNRKLRHCEFLDEEENAIKAMKKYFATLNTGGVLLRLGDGTAAGFSIYSFLADGQTCDIHFEKADHSIKGAPQQLTRMLSRHLLEKGARWMNREQDMGEPGLRQAKRSLDPCGMVNRLFLRAREGAIS